jgi:hypothetical protein
VAKATILLTDEIPAPPALVRLGIETLPVTIGAGNERTRLRFIQFFAANIRNRNTRRLCAGGQAVLRCPKYVIKRGKTPVLFASRRGRPQRLAGATSPRNRPATVDAVDCTKLIGLGVHPKYPPFISRIRRFFCPPGAVRFVVV